MLEASAALCAVNVERDRELKAAAIEVALASGELAAAIVAVPTDRMAVPGHVASAIGGWVAGYAGGSAQAMPRKGYGLSYGFGVCSSRLRFPLATWCCGLGCR